MGNGYSTVVSWRWTKQPLIFRATNTRNNNMTSSDIVSSSSRLDCHWQNNYVCITKENNNQGTRCIALLSTHRWLLHNVHVGNVSILGFFVCESSLASTTVVMRRPTLFCWPILDAALYVNASRQSASQPASECSTEPCAFWNPWCGLLVDLTTR